MDYDEFKDYIMTHLWKMGDSVVYDKLDVLIATAESELNRVFKVEDRNKLVTLTVTSNVVPLPTDCREVRSLTYPHRGENMALAMPAEFFSDPRSNGTGVFDPSIYAIVNKSIYLLGQVTQETLTLLYYSHIPKFAALPGGSTSWVCQEYLDVYLYCVLKHTAPFLREDERVALWQNMYGEALSTAMDENTARKFAGSPLKIKFKTTR